MTEVDLNALIADDKKKHQANKKKKINKNTGGPHAKNNKSIGKFGKFRKAGFNDEAKGSRNHNNNHRNDSRKPLRVKRRAQKPQKEFTPKAQRKQSEQVHQKGRTLKILGLHPDFSNKDLFELVSSEGAVQKCYVEVDDFGRSLTTALVRFRTADIAKKATGSLNGKRVMNSDLSVEPYKKTNKK